MLALGLWLWIIFYASVLLFSDCLCRWKLKQNLPVAMKLLLVVLQRWKPQSNQKLLKRKKKRKDTESKSKVWEHFEKIFEEGKLVKAKCLYRAKKLHANPKINGTSSVRNHMLVCMKNPNPKSIRQSLLTLQPDLNNSKNVGVIGTWPFDNDDIRKALSNMRIVDELPFKFVEGEGFKDFMSVA